MRKVCILIYCMFITYTAMAQQSTKQREIGLVFSNLDNFGLTYKTGTEKSVWRYSVLLISGNETKTIDKDNTETKNNKFGFGFKVGDEYRKRITDNFEFRIGADFSFNYIKLKDTREKNTGINNDVRKSAIYEPGVNLVLGFNYVVAENIVVGAELLPYLSYRRTNIKSRSDIVSPYGYTTGVEKEITVTGFSYGISNSSVMLSLSYRF
ncbi:MAG: hypothetical protein N4A72_07485 [Bacteroidales bacterium]|nr:hypothetical protein [Bacteroidales bacterium]